MEEKKRRLNKRNAIAMYFDKGYTVDDILCLTGASYCYVIRVLKSTGRRVVIAGKMDDMFDTKKLVEAYRSGLGMRAACELAGVSYMQGRNYIYQRKLNRGITYQRGRNGTKVGGKEN